MVRSLVTPRPLSASGGGKEELRSTLLKPYLLRLRAERGEPIVRALLASAGISPSLLEDESGWISVSAARRALSAIASTLGEAAIVHRGEWTTHPETLGAYVRMLRVATGPLDAYRYLATHSSESTRIGRYEFEDSGSNTVKLSYIPRVELESAQNDPLLCLARQGELTSMPRIWGLEEAQVESTRCLARGDARCAYRVRWSTPERRQVPLGMLAGASLCGSTIGLSGSLPATVIGTLLGTGLGGVIGQLSKRVQQERASRAFEKHRILALERGLELRGQLRELTGELTGSVLGGKYRIRRKIGSGGIGAVYEAEHIALGLQVAVKVLRGAAAMDAAETARLRREARVQVSIEHPNVVRTLDLDPMPDGSIYVVMELLRGKSLAEHLKQRCPLAPGFAIPVFIQVCRALVAAHRLGIVHRDLKPGNIFITDDETVKVLDFGMSKFSEAEALTQAGYTLGTPEYMSPEQCIGASVEARSDLYAFGVMMYEALTGEIPIRGKNRRELLDLHQRQVPMTLAEMRPDLDFPKELDAAVMMCLKKRAAELPKNARVLEAMLEAVPKHDLIREYPSSVPRRSPRRAAPHPR